MRVKMIVKANKDSAAGKMPSEELDDFGPSDAINRARELEKELERTK